MLTKQKAKLLISSLKAGKTEAKIVFDYLNRKNNKLSASAVSNLSKKVKNINAIADKSMTLLAKSFNSPKEVVTASKYPVVENLLSEASSLKATALLLANLIDVGDELAVLPEETVVEADENCAELPEEKAEANEDCKPIIDSEDDAELPSEEVEADDDIELPVEADDEEITPVEADDEVELPVEADDDIELPVEADDEEITPFEEVKSSRKNKARFVRARKAQPIGVKAALNSLNKVDIWNFGKSGK